MASDEGRRFGIRVRYRRAITLPLALPANFIDVLYIQLRMVAAIAAMGGHDVRSDQVHTLCYACLCGRGVTDVIKRAGITVGRKLTQAAIRGLPVRIIYAVNKAVCFRLVTKFGQKGVVNLHKFIPVAGGVVGGSLDSFGTYAVGTAARKIFIGAQQSVVVIVQSERLPTDRS